MTIHILHENPEWLAPLTAALDRQGLPWQDWFLGDAVIDPSSPPPEGVFWSRMSASAHTRDHLSAPQVTASVIDWLESHGRVVINGNGALDLEVSKARQAVALKAAGIDTVRTIIVGARSKVVEAARNHFAGQSVIYKPNCGGKGLGVRLFHSIDGLNDYLNGPDYEEPIDGIHLLQDYIRTAEPLITRAEFVGGRFLYAVEVDNSEGFELCPADACEIGDANCPVGEQPKRNKFEIIAAIDKGLQEKLEGFLDHHRIGVAGVEFFTTPEGRHVVYDINTNTNYNAAAEARAGLAETDRSGPGAVAAYLGRLLHSSTSPRAANTVSLAG